MPPPRVVLCLAVSLALASAPCRAAEDAIVQRGFDAFAKGTPGNSGANLYVSRNGHVRPINTWDLNGDGYMDVVSSNDHDVFEVVDAFVYWNSRRGFRSLMPELWKDRPLADLVFKLEDGNDQLTRLPAFGGGRSIVADLNKDGLPEIVFCNYIHNYPGLRSAYVYWGSRRGYQRHNRTDLPTAWAAGVAAVDVNGDGYPELVFANQGTEAGAEDIQMEKDSGSYIYWGSATGYQLSERTTIQTHGARDVAAGDFNHDGRADLAFINNGPKGKDLQVFLGTAGGFEANPAEVIPLGDPTSIRAGDANRDGFCDLVVTASAPPQTISLAGMKKTDDQPVVAFLFAGGADGISEKRLKRLPALQARDALLADLNGDKWPEIVLANSSDGKTSRVPSYIYWGSADGFSPEHRTDLPTLGANGASAADFNGDGFTDLIFANSSDDHTHDVQSYIYWGSSTGFAPYLRSELQGFGAASVNAADLDGDGRPEVVLVNQYSGKAAEINSHIYWGNPHHYYSTASMTRLPSHGAYGTTGADLDDDGLCDLVICNYYQSGSYLYKGTPRGFGTENRQTLDVGPALASTAADLNRDGYLDLVFTGSRNEKNTIAILWGSAEGFTDKNQTVLALRTQRSANIAAADLNRDGYLDLVTNDDYFGNMEIFWGGAEPYSEKRSWFHATSGGSLGLADLDGDGILDFVITGGFDPKRLSPNTKTRIYRGTAQGTPSFDKVIELEAYQACEVAIADLNRDEHLDLVLGNYMSESTRSLPLFVYWGGPGGTYSDSRRLDLPAESSCGVETLDLNRDGYPEIVIHNHLKDGNHSINTYIYWNGPEGFDRDRKTELPDFGPHYTAMTDPGNLYTRRLEEEYLSAPLQIPDGRRPASIRWEADEPSGSRVHFQIRSAARVDGLVDARWYPAGDGKLAGVADRDRWIQYRVVFTSPDGGAWPTLSAVEFPLR